MFQYDEETTGISEMPKYLLSTSKDAAVPPLRAETMLAAGFPRK